MKKNLKASSPYSISTEQAAARQQRDRVELVLREIGLDPWRAEILDAHRELTGEEGRLSFLAFDQVFPGFPICLESLPLYSLGLHTQCNQTAMFRNFAGYVPYQKFLEVRELLQARSEGRPVGILYRWPGIRHGLILHDGVFPANGFKQVYVDSSVHVTVEHFRRFLRTLAASNITLESLRSPPRIATTEHPLPSLTPWGVACRCQSEPEFRILAFIVEVLFHMAPTASTRYIVRKDGQRWLAIREDDLAKRLSISTRTIQRAIASLRTREIIETQRDDCGKNQIRLCTEPSQ